MSEWISFCLKSFGLILSSVTTVFTVLLWGSLPEDTWSSILMGVAGFALEGSKFLLLLLALLFMKRKQILASIVGGVLAMLLFVVSVGASVGFLEMSEQQQQRSSDAWSHTQKSISQIDSEIETLLASVRADIENGYRDRGLKTRAGIQSLREQRETLLETPENMPVDSSFGGLASMLGMDNQSVRLYAWLLLAVLIDGVAAACWAFLVLLNETETVLEIPKEVETPKREQLAEPAKMAEPQKQPETFSEIIDDSTIGMFPDETVSDKVLNCSLADVASVIIDNHDPLYEQVKQKIDIGQPGYDSSLTLNKLMKLESVGYQKARRVMDRLSG